MKRPEFLKHILGRGEPMEQIDLVVKELSSMLHGRNYTVFIRRYKIPLVPGATPDQYVITALPDAIVRGVEPASIVDIIAEVEGSLAAGHLTCYRLPDSMSRASPAAMGTSFSRHHLPLATCH